MVTNLGKRKRKVVEVAVKKVRRGSESSEPSEVDAQEIFRRHFEAQFAPLPNAPQQISQSDGESKDTEEEGGEDEEWEGVLEDEGGAIEVVQHGHADSRPTTMSKQELKAFMSFKPPSTITQSPLLRDKATTSVDDDDASEAANLKKDLALQRLLAESHLLDSSTNPVLSGTNRHKATDLRMQALGSKVSLLKQEKMPMSHRKGITAKKTKREETRRKEAKENGIILERPQLKKKVGEGKRDRGVGGPGIGRFAGGTLRLSKKDIFAIEGPKRKGAKGAKSAYKGKGKRK